jgi:hypothetical protein
MARVLTRGGTMLALFDPVKGLVEFGGPAITAHGSLYLKQEIQIQIQSRILTSSSRGKEEQKGSNFLTKTCVSAPSRHVNSMEIAEAADFL